LVEVRSASTKNDQAPAGPELDLPGVRGYRSRDGRGT